MLLWSGWAHATHLVGGEMYYDYIGNDQYEVHLIIYRDCGPTNTNGTGFDTDAALGIYEGNTLFSTLTVPLDFNTVTEIDLQSGNPCAQLPPGVCVERALYNTIITLPPSEEAYTIVHQRCCRNPQVINLIDPMNTGFSIFGTVPPVLGNPDLNVDENSSPRFDFLPQAYVCLGEPFTLANPAEDLDGDSLLFTLGDLFIGGTPTAPSPNPPLGPPFDNVTWESGFTAQYPMGTAESDWISIDPSTGTVTGIPNQVGKYVVGIYVNEFRQDSNGNWMNLGKMVRDFTIDVVACELELPNITWPQPCTGLAVDFGVDADQGVFSWDFGETGEEDVSAETAPSHTYNQQGQYNVSLAFDLGGCGDSLQQTILVGAPIEATFELLGAQCAAGGWNQEVVFSGDPPGSSGSLVWYVDENEAGTGTSTPPLLVPPGNHTITATLTNEIGCVAEFDVDVELDALPQAVFAISTPPCNGLDVSFSNASLDAVSFQWTFDLSDPGTGVGPESTSESPDWTYADYGAYTAQLIAQPGEACADTTTATVNVYPEDPLVMSFSATEPLACSMETTVDFIFTGNNANTISWDFGSAGSASGDTITFDFETSGAFPVSLTIENEECGTQQTSDFEVYVPELVSELELVIPNVLTPNADGKNDRFRVGTRRIDDNGVIPTNTASFSQFRLQIYDRWGVRVHQSEGVGAGWDGRIGGEVAAPGTYYYILNADHGCLDNEIEEVGELTLILD
jgi:gliding motility-associated-like protein